MPPTVREVIRQLEAEGWRQIGQTGSHRHFENPTKPGKVTVPGALGEEVKPGTLAAIRRQAGMRGKLK